MSTKTRNSIHETATQLLAPWEPSPCPTGHRTQAALPAQDSTEGGATVLRRQGPPPAESGCRRTNPRLDLRPALRIRPSGREGLPRCSRRPQMTAILPLAMAGLVSRTQAGNTTLTFTRKAGILRLPFHLRPSMR